MDLVRKILLAVEEEDSYEIGDIPEIPDYSSEQIAYHVEIMEEAGLLDASIEGVMGSPVPIILLRRMTWTGHEFLDTARNQSVWDQAKGRTLNATGGLGFDLLKGVLLDLARQALG